MIRWRDWVEQLATSVAARARLNQRFADSEHQALYWETAPSCAPGNTAFSDVVLNSPALARVTADPGPFARHFDNGQMIARFHNRGHDARLIAPCPLANAPGYPHLAAFTRHAPKEQIDALWRVLGEEILAWWSQRDDPVWVNTSGLGVHWLHLRLDRRPKYYKHRPFRTPPK